MNSADLRFELTEDLRKYDTHWLKNPPIDTGESKEIVTVFLEFVSQNPHCFSRENLAGHITGSGYVVDKTFTKVLLTHHRKLNDWLQLGGHADGDPLAYQVALKECEEESGLKNFKFVELEKVFREQVSHPLIFDLDRHIIPARKNEPEHFHYDVRYLLIADPTQPLVITEESKDLRWVEIVDAYEMAKQSSMHRPFKKIAYLRDKLAQL